MLISASASDCRHWRGARHLGCLKRCSSDRHQTAVGIDQMLRAEPGGLELHLDMQQSVRRAPNHGRLHRQPPHRGAWDAKLTGQQSGHPTVSLATRRTRSSPTTRNSLWQHCTSDHAAHLDRAEDAGAPRAYLAAARSQVAEYRYELALGLVERGVALATVEGDR